MGSRAMKTMAAAALLLLLALAHCGLPAEAKTFLHCGENGNSRPSGRYRANVRAVVGRMGKFTVRMPDLAYRTYEVGPDVFGMSFCSTGNRPDCAACVKAAVRDIKKCGNVFGATATRKGCKVRFDYFQFF